MRQLINFWKDLVISGEKNIYEVPDKIRNDVINRLVDSGHISENDIDIVRSAKVAEMSLMCNKVIVDGFDITLSDDETHHFSLEVSDQLKISKLNDRAMAGITTLPYHADGESCRFYSAEDVMAINTVMENLIEFQVTYFNSLRDYINSLTDISTVCDVKYGDEIPTEYQSEVLKMLYSQAYTTEN